jgi:hypothetical protein
MSEARLARYVTRCHQVTDSIATVQAPLRVHSRLDERRPIGAAALIVLALLSAGSAEATRLALIPVAGERVTLDDAPRLEALDKSLRKAATGVAGYTIQPRRQTSAHLAAARELGLRCALDDAMCASKLAVLAEVDEVVFPVAGFANGMIEVRLLLFASGGDRQVAEVKADVPASSLSEDFLKALLTTLVKDRPPPPMPAQPAPAPAPTAAPAPAPAAQAAPDDNTPALSDDAPQATETGEGSRHDQEKAAAAAALEESGSIVGPAVMGLGVVVLGAGVVLTSAAWASAGVIELLLNPPRAPDERALLQLGGQALLVVGGVGLLVVGLGGVVTVGGLFIE